MAAPIGPASLAILQAGVRHGFRRAFATAIGVVLADATFLLVVFFGLGAVVEEPAVRVGLWSIGALVLVYMGARSLWDAIVGITLSESEQPYGRHPLLTGFAVNIANPLAIVWWLGIFGSLLAEGSESSRTWSGLPLAASVLLGILLWHTAIGLLSHGGRRWLNGRLLRVVTGAAGSALVAFGLRFAKLAIEAISRSGSA